MRTFTTHRSICKALLQPIPAARGKPGGRKMPTSSPRHSCPACGCTSRFPGVGRGTAGNPASCQRGGDNVTHSCHPAEKAMASGAARRGPARPRHGAVPPMPTGRLGGAGCSSFITCKTSLGSTPSNLGVFLIAGTCLAGERRGLEPWERWGLPSLAPVSPDTAWEGDPHLGTTRTPQHRLQPVRTMGTIPPASPEPLALSTEDAACLAFPIGTLAQRGHQPHGRRAPDGCGAQRGHAKAFPRTSVPERR